MDKFDRTTLTPAQMDTLNRAYVLISVHGVSAWKRRYKVLTELPQTLKDEIEEEYRD